MVVEEALEEVDFVAEDFEGELFVAGDFEEALLAFEWEQQGQVEDPLEELVQQEQLQDLPEVLMGILIIALMDIIIDRGGGIVDLFITDGGGIPIGGQDITTDPGIILQCIWEEVLFLR